MGRGGPELSHLGLAAAAGVPTVLGFAGRSLADPEAPSRGPVSDPVEPAAEPLSAEDAALLREAELLWALPLLEEWDPVENAPLPSTAETDAETPDPPEAVDAPEPSEAVEVTVEEP